MTSPDQSQDLLDKLAWSSEVPKEPGVYLTRWRFSESSAPPTVTVTSNPALVVPYHPFNSQAVKEWCRVPERSEELECCGSPIGCEALHAGMCPDERPRG